MYFKYGIKNSTLDVQEDQPVELTVAGRSPSSESVVSGYKTTSLNR
jgi:hypothetical protein